MKSNSSLLSLLIVGLSPLASCGAPEPPNIRQEFAKGLRPLGITAVYPLSESLRLGQVYLVDLAAGEEGGDPDPSIPTARLVTDAAVDEMERMRSTRLADKRFPCSADNLAQQLGSGNETRAYYRQSVCTPSTLPAKSTEKTPPAAAVKETGDVPPATGEVTSLSEQATGSLPPLALAGLPSYSLASIDNLSLAGSVPSTFANFLAAIGFRETTSLRVQAEGVEIASLPDDVLVNSLRTLCSSPKPNNPFYYRTLAEPILIFSEKQMRFSAQDRAEKLGKSDKQIDLGFYMITKVFYLRGIRYIFSNAKAYSALIEAAASAGNKKVASQPPVVPNISMNVVAPSTGGAQSTAKPDVTSSEIAALQNQIDALRAAISSNTNVQVGGTYARATAQGIEFVDMFQRPLAFGYQAFARSYSTPARGYQGLCASVGIGE